MAYAVISYPDLEEKNFQQIQKYREINDEWLFNVVLPHFSFVFPVSNISKTEFIEEISKLSEDVKSIDFAIRCAAINKDSFADYYHAFLVPDEGYSQIVKLHDKLYSGLLFNNLRLDIDFIPHIGIGNSKDKFKCKTMIDELNKMDFEIKGSISELSIVNYENNNIVELHKIRLK